MKLSQCLFSAFTISTALAAPASVPQLATKFTQLHGGKGLPGSKKATGTMSDIDILHYAMTLENLENAFYRDIVANYSQHDFLNDGFADPFFDDLKAIAAEEAAHVKSLSATLKALGAPVPKECTYNWGPIEGAVDVVTLANIIEGASRTYIPQRKTI